MGIQFSSHRTRFKLSNPHKTSAWIEKAAKSERAKIASLSYIFCTDQYLLGINQQFLNHDTLTDIITFDYRESTSGAIEGEIYISIPRVRENAKLVGTTFDLELHRVIIHGLLHLVGYKDKSTLHKKEMRATEEKYLHRLK